MNQTPTSLIELLRMMEGLLPAPRDQALREQLVEQPEARHRFQQLRQAADANPLQLDDEPPTEQIDEQTIAAFLEEHLDPTQTARVEQACWDSPAMLAEIVSQFRFLNAHESAEQPSLSPELAKRLLTVGDASALTTLGDSDARTAATRRPTKPNRRTYILPIAVLALLALFVGLWSVWRPETSPSSDPPRIAEDVDAPATNKSPHKNVPAPQPKHNRNTVQTPEPPSKRPSESVVVEQPIPPTPNDPSPLSSPSPPTITWLRMTGLIARQDSGSTTWIGWNNKKPLPLQTTFAALPASWGLAQLPQHFSIVINEDTELSLTSTNEPDQPLSLRLRRGRIALLELPQSQRVLLHLGIVEWNLEALAAGTSIGVIWDPEEPQLLVQSGEVTIGRSRFRKGRQVVWSDEGFRASQPLRENTDWFDTPPTALPIPRKLQQSLQAAPDLLAQLQEQLGSSDESTRRIARFWSFSLAPQQAVATALASPTPEHRTAAVDWMLARSANDPQLATALASFAARSNDNAAPVRIARWLDLVRAKQRPTTALAAQLLRALAHDRLPIRHIADQCLQRLTGMQTAYRADAPPPARRRGIEQWSRLLRGRRDRK